MTQARRHALKELEEELPLSGSVTHRARPPRSTRAHRPLSTYQSLRVRGVAARRNSPGPWWFAVSQREGTKKLVLAMSLHCPTTFFTLQGVLEAVGRKRSKETTRSNGGWRRIGHTAWQNCLPRKWPPAKSTKENAPSMLGPSVFGCPVWKPNGR